MTRFDALPKFTRAAFICATILAVLCLQTNAFPADRPALIAVASNGNEATSLISRDPVHSAYCLLFAATGELLEVLENPYRGGPKGAEEGMADFLARHRVDVVVAEYFSPGLIRMMEAKGIRPVVFEGLAREAVRRILPGIERR